MSKYNLGALGSYKVRMTSHSLQRSKQRKVDTMKILAAIATLGTEKLNEYANKKIDILIKDKTQNISIVIAVTTKKITIITVIHDIDVYDANYPDTIIQEI